MSAKQNSKGVRWGRAAAHVGLVGAWMALVAACSGSIEETDVDRTRSDFASNNPAPAPEPTAPSPSTTTPVASTTPSASPPPASPPPASPPPASPPPAAPPPAAPSGDLSFETDIYPIFTSSCTGCHGANGFVGVSVADPNVEAARESAIAEEDRILSEIEAGDMPQGCNAPPGGGGSCLSEEEFAMLEAWYEAGAPE